MLGDPVELKWNAKDLESLKAVLARHCPLDRGEVAVQAGGCLGVFAKHLAREFSRVYTFEPDPELFRLLVENVPEPNVVKLQVALGERRGRMLRTECALRGNDGKTVLHPGMTRTEVGGIIPTLRLDDLALDACDLIYLDVEGDEFYALQGALRTISTLKPVVVCEVNRGIDYRGIEREAVGRFLTSLGYREAEKLRSDVVFVPRFSP